MDMKLTKWVVQAQYMLDCQSFCFRYLEGTDYFKSAKHCWSIPNYILRCPDYELDAALRLYWKRQEKNANSAYLSMIDSQIENLLKLKETIMTQL